MTDVLKIARDKSERLVKEAEETSDLVQSAEFFIRGIQKYRERIGEDVQDIEGFISAGIQIVERGILRPRPGRRKADAGHDLQSLGGRMFDDIM